MNLSLRWKKLKACFDVLSQTFPCFQYYYWVIDNVAALNFCNDFAIAKIGT